MQFIKNDASMPIGIVWTTVTVWVHSSLFTSWCSRTSMAATNSCEAV